MEKIRVLIVDDHPLFRQGVRLALETEPDFEVAGEAADGKDALQMARDQAPDLILLDVNIPVIDGLEVARLLKLHLPSTGVVILTAYDDEDQLFHAIRVGAAAYFPKDVSPEKLVTALRRVAQGEYIINDNLLSRPMVASRVLKQFSELAAATKDVEPFFAPLSPREMQILDYISQGNSNKEIARTLRISDQTVKNHITSILRKLNVNDRTEAVVYAMRRGWIKI
jgi:DNA-binding NarL/FixJ family response regulator